MAYLANTLSVGCGRLEITDEKGTTRSFQEMCPTPYEIKVGTFPPGVKEWSYGVEGWYRVITTLTTDGKTTILAEGSWSTWGNDYVNPSRHYKEDRENAIKAIPQEVLDRNEAIEKNAAREREVRRKQSGGFLNGRWVEPVA